MERASCLGCGAKPHWSERSELHAFGFLALAFCLCAEGILHQFYASTQLLSKIICTNISLQSAFFTQILPCSLRKILRKIFRKLMLRFFTKLKFKKSYQNSIQTFFTFGG